MELLWITVLLFLVTGVIPGQTTDEDPEMWLIDRIDRTDKGSTKAQTSDKFKFTLKNPTNTDATTILLEMYAKELTEGPVSATDTSIPSAPVFEVDLTNYFGSDTNFLVTAKDGSGADLAYATANLPFPKFPGDTETTTLPDPRDTPNGILVRVQGILEDMSLTSSGTLFQGDISYFEFPNISSANYFPCNNSNGVEVCDKELTHSVLTGKVNDKLVSSAVLAYGPNGNATIKLSSYPNTEGIQEAILIPPSSQGNQGNVLCNNKENRKCTINWKQPSANVLKLIIVQKTTIPDAGSDKWATYFFEIHDRELFATNLGDTILEGRWKMLQDEKTYFLTKTSLTEGETNLIEVDCSHLTEMCFGYFPHMEKGNYTLTVMPETENGNLNQTESLPVEFSAPTPLQLEILSRHTTTHQNQQKADVQICFQHLTPTERRSFSHYEMLIINEKGQWLKHSIMQEEKEEANEERLCFTPFTINTKDFDLTEGAKVVVSQRGVDGVSVLASGVSALF